MAALTFCFDTLRTGGHFVCKFYQGSEDKALEQRLKRLFEKVHRDKPESSRKVSFPIPILTVAKNRAGVEGGVLCRAQTEGIPVER
jgi:21S rRNA (uridine2791-2'-O)-methyltransferase